MDYGEVSEGVSRRTQGSKCMGRETDWSLGQLSLRDCAASVKTGPWPEGGNKDIEAQ